MMPYTGGTPPEGGTFFQASLFKKGEDPPSIKIF